MDDFEQMLLGNAGANKAANGNNSSDTPAFLMDDPPFLSGDAKASGGDAAPSFLDGLGDPAPSSSGAAGKRANESASLLDNERRPLDGVSSAEKLNFIGESGYHWNLTRERILGKGTFGCATVYVQDTSVSGAAVVNENQKHALRRSSSRVVVKDINMQTMNNKAEEMASLRTEVEVLRLSAGHPGLVQFLDYFQSDFMVYILLECCDGGDLGGVIETGAAAGKPLPEEFVASMLIQVLTGLNYLHMDEHILHRDMKPQNVFLLRDRWTARLGDFGIAIKLGSVGTKAKEACGSPFYMAPELCEERAYDGEADVWSTGVLLYELAALQRPFQASTLAALVPLIVKGRCASLHDRRDLPYSKELRDLIMSMLTVDPAARPTMRRLLRSSYVRQNLHTVPAAVLDTKYYKDLYGAEEVAAARKRCTQPGIPIVAETASAAPAEAGDEYEDDFE